jgi:hypothetical protein
MPNIEPGALITTGTIPGAASISKQFTAMRILLLAQRGSTPGSVEFLQSDPPARLMITFAVTTNVISGINNLTSEPKFVVL